MTVSRPLVCNTMSSGRPQLLSLPGNVLEGILLETQQAAELRCVCKTFAMLVANSAACLKLSQCAVRNRERFLHVLSTFLYAKQLVINFADVRGSLEKNCGHDKATCGGPTTVEDDGSLVAEALDALATVHHPVTSFIVRHLSQPLRLPSPAVLSYLASCGLTEMELQDDSIERAAADGVSNLMRSPSVRDSTPLVEEAYDAIAPRPPAHLSLADSIRARGAAMVRLALAVPSLRRLSLCNAAFSSGDVAALGALSQLEELSLVGAMECAPGIGPGSATAVYRELMAGLPTLRRLRLPMAVTSVASSTQVCCGVHIRDDSDFDDSDDSDVDTTRAIPIRRDYGGDALSLSSDGHLLAGQVAMYGLGGGVPTATFLGSGTAGASDCTSQHKPMSSSWKGLPVAGWRPEGGQVGRALYSVTPCSDPSSSGRTATSTEALNVKVSAGTPSTATSAPSGLAFPSCAFGESSASVQMASAATHAAMPAAVAASWSQPPQAGGCGPSSALGPQWRLPPLLEELTIPLCALNGPIFHAACDVYGSDAGSGGGGDGGGSGSRLRALHILCAPGYTVWEGSFLNSECSFRSLSRLTSLETLNLSLELGASGRRALRRDSLRACLRHLRALNRLKEIGLYETQQPRCFSTRKAKSMSPPSLLSYILDMHGGDHCAHGAAAQLRGLPRLHDFALNMTSPYQRRGLTPPSRPPSAAALTSLLSHWPQLQRLVAGGQGVVRTRLGGRDCLIMIGSPEQQLGALGEGLQAEEREAEAL